MRRFPVLRRASVAGRLLRVAGVGFGFVAACAASHEPPRPDDACATACEARLPRCGAKACVRGCELALDRLVEGQGDTVLACVERSPAPCGEWLWATCAAQVGPHEDGGPPAPVSGARH